MNGYLLDTHVWLWLIAGGGALSQSNQDQITRWQQSGKLCLSSISAWEVSQKQSTGKLGMDGDVTEWVEMTTGPGFLQLMISPSTTSSPQTVFRAVSTATGQTESSPRRRVSAT